MLRRVRTISLIVVGSLRGLKRGQLAPLILLSTRPFILDAYLADLLFAPRHSRDRFATARAAATGVLLCGKKPLSEI
jgi:hypothetical protein